MIRYSMLSEQGDRKKNEDFMGVAERDGQYFFVVCDGLGGHGMGEVASQFVVSSCMQSFYEAQQIDDDFLGNTIMTAQNGLLEKQRIERAFGHMKTTCVAMLINDEYASWIHVGDSRLNYFIKNKYKLHTRDHSVPEQLYKAGWIKEKEIRNHPDRSRLLRVMGSEWEEPRYELSGKLMLKKKKRHSFLLCTDGFWELVDEKQMQKLLKESSTVDTWLDSLASEVKKNGMESDMDNYTAIAVFAE